MKIITQLGIIAGICLVSEGISLVLPFTMPASVIGMILMALLLMAGLLKKEHIQDVSGFLLGNLPFFFIPAVVGLVNYLDVLSANAGKILIVTTGSLLITFAVTAWTVRLVTALTEKKEGGK